MKNRSKQKNHMVARARRLSIISASGMIVVMVVYLSMTIYGAFNMNKQIRMLTEHPYAVTNALGKLQVDMAKMEGWADRIKYYHQPEEVEKIRSFFKSTSQALDGALADIGSAYLGPKEDVVRLWQACQKIQQAHLDFLAFSADPKNQGEDIDAYEQKRLEPLYDDFQNKANHIYAYSMDKKAMFYSTADAQWKSTVAWSIVILSTTIAGLAIFQLSLERLYRQIHLKNQQFDSLARTIDDAFFIFTRSQPSCDFVAENIQRILGISADQVYQDRTLLYQYLSKEKGEEIRKKVYEKEPKLPWESLVEHHNPLTRQTQMLLIQIYLSGKIGEDYQFIVTIVDRTQDCRDRQALIDAMANAEQANSAKRDFLSRMSHEVRTPINAIIGLTTIAEASLGNPAKLEDCLSKIGIASKHLLMLINDILDMSRMESNKLQLNAEPFDIGEFVSSFVAITYPQAHLKGVEFSEKTTGFHGKKVFVGDAFRLNQILLNLVSNAIKFTDKGGKVSLHIERLPSRGPEAWLRFTVTDTGIGMDQEGLKKIYTPFEQADSKISQKYGGTGLGMPITRNLTTLMGGTINVESKLGVGTACTVELPFEIGDQSFQPHISPDTRKQGPEPGRRLLGKQILAAEDNELNLEIARELLERQGARVTCAADGAEAVEFFAQSKPGYFDAILMDVQMPVLNGYQATQKIRAMDRPDAKTISIIAVTANVFNEDVAEALRAGMNAHISKPMDMEQLCMVLAGQEESS